MQVGGVVIVEGKQVWDIFDSVPALFSHRGGFSGLDFGDRGGIALDTLVGRSGGDYLEVWNVFVTVDLSVTLASTPCLPPAFSSRGIRCQVDPMFFEF